MKPIFIRTFLEFQFVSAPAFSPDGEKIAFVVQKADLENNDYKGDLYLYDCTVKKTLRLTSSGNIKKFEWTKAGTILFLTNEKGGKEPDKPMSRLYEISVSGGESAEKFSIPLQLTSFYECEDGRFVIAAVAENFSSKDPAYEVFDEIPFWANGKGITNKKRMRLYVYEPTADSLVPVCDEWCDCSSYSVRGGRILYKAYTWRDLHQKYDGSIFTT